MVEHDNVRKKMYICICDWVTLLYSKKKLTEQCKHVSTYNIILESHLEKAKEQFEALRAQGEVEGTFEEAVFATFPYGIVIERVKFPQFTNTEYVKEII